MIVGSILPWRPTSWILYTGNRPGTLDIHHLSSDTKMTTMVRRFTNWAARGRALPLVAMKGDPSLLQSRWSRRYRVPRTTEKTTQCLRRHHHSVASRTYAFLQVQSNELVRQVSTSARAPSALTTSLPLSLDVAAQVTGDGAAISISFDPETQSIFHAPWLWSNDPTYVHKSSRQRMRSPGQYPGTRIRSASIVSSSCAVRSTGSVVPTPSPPKSWCHPIAGGSNTNPPYQSANADCPLLCITWTSPESGGTDGEVSYYDLAWLRHWRYDDQARETRRRRSEVAKDHAIRRPRGQEIGIPSIQYSALIADEQEETFQLLHAIFRHGAALVQGAPLVSSGPRVPVGRIGKLLGGWLSHGALYDDIFHVKSLPDAHNIAYTTTALRPHQDLVYYESSPGLQLLHCVCNDGILGGESVMIDALAAANELRCIAPSHFLTLTQCPATFVKQREGADMVYRRPHIVADTSGEIVTVNWSPPFEGPLSIPSHMVGKYYDAYSAFESILDNSLPRKAGRTNSTFPGEQSHILAEYAHEHTWERKLQPGEILVFNNRRMLHARRSFSLDPTARGDVGRHLVGCYTNIDDTLCRYRVLSRQRCGDLEVLNVGNGTNAIY